MHAVALLADARSGSQARRNPVSPRSGPFVPSDSQAARDYADIIRGDFEVYITDIQELLPLPRTGTRAGLRGSPRSQPGLRSVSGTGGGLMGTPRACIRLAPLGNQTPITPSYIYFLDNRFHPLATSQKVCDAWRKTIRSKWSEGFRASALVDARNKAGLSQKEVGGQSSNASPIVRCSCRKRRAPDRRHRTHYNCREGQWDLIPSMIVLAIVEAATEPDHKI